MKTKLLFASLLSASVVLSGCSLVKGELDLQRKIKLKQQIDIQQKIVLQPQKIKTLQIKYTDLMKNGL